MPKNLFCIANTFYWFIADMYFSVCIFLNSCSVKHDIVSFLRLTVSLFALSHVLTFSSSKFKMCVILSKCVPSMKTLVSSANKIEKSRSEHLEKSFIYIINKTGPKIDP